MNKMSLLNMNLIKKTIVLTGKLENYTRDEAQAIIEKIWWQSKLIS